MWNFESRVHENPDCGPLEKDGKRVPGLAAGGHFDPQNTGRHEGPYGDGHLGDLPPLYADEHGRATLPVLAPRIKVKDIKGRSLMIHAGGDNYSDHPAKLGGGGARIACGVVP
ncbi:MAG: superoxide dismutase family protein [Desulfobacterales bacterium]|nr:superoxide dismutase family protein [Desulfobacterales bacterium]